MELTRLRPRAGLAEPDPWSAPRWLIEDERRLDGSIVPSVTVFLIGAECPFQCVFCDLWRHTLERPTPAGTLPRQLALAFAEIEAVSGRPRQLKLYNASNFFDERAVPAGDLAAIARLCRGFERVVVECHPRLIGKPAGEFAERIDGDLEVAMGLETIHPQALRRYDKGMDLNDYRRAAAFLAEHGVGHRSFVLVRAPFVPAEESTEWTEKSVEFACEHGAVHAALIPLRVDTPGLAGIDVPTLADLEDAVAAVAAVSGAVVTADLWDLDRLRSCAACRSRRVRRLQAFNRTGVWSAAPITCDDCGEAA